MDWIVLLAYLTISTNFRWYYRVTQQDSAPVHLALNTVQLLLCKTLNFLTPEPITVQSLTPLTMRFRESYSSMLQVRRLNNLSQRLVEVCQCNSTAFE